MKSFIVFCLLCCSLLAGGQTLLPIELAEEKRLLKEYISTMEYSV